MAKNKKIKNKEKTIKRKQNHQNLLHKHYSLSWQYIKESKNYIFLILFIFLFSAAIGVYYQPPEISEMIREILQELIEQTQGLNTWQLIIFILDNNLQTSFFAMIFGIALGIIPILITFSNGYILGFVMEKAITAQGTSTLLQLLPHGIFELPAVIIALAIGTRFGLFFKAGKGKIKKEFVYRLEQSLRTFLFVILPLLIIAAIIEGILIGVIS
jgi:stage II sporulation protein M